MVHAIYAPRVNNNDDEVQLVNLGVQVGQRVKAGAVVATVETAKAALDVEADREGFVLRIDAALSDFVQVGQPFIWLGESADEQPPSKEAKQKSGAMGSAGAVTAKAAILLKRHGLSAEHVPMTGERLTVTDVEAYLAKSAAKVGAAPAAAAAPSRWPGPSVPGAVRPMTAVEKGMLSTVSWHRDEAVAGYIEYAADARPWTEWSEAYGKERGMMTSPLLGLLTHRLVSIAKEMPIVNTTVQGSGLYRYDHVNVGFTVQVDDTLYLAVVREAESLDADAFLSRMGELQRRAFAHKLDDSETSGATVAFSSMARWGIARHVPILPPYTALIVAHAAVDAGGRMVLGASYDHRVLSGADVTKVLRALSKPAAERNA
jgi:pyruvate/2-oxoglutarate dehydrogenase complex dihydrolipoamide acyltransferase (E2) component